MPSARQYLRNWMRWQRGRQGTGYDKLLILVNPLIIPFDLYLLRFPEGTEIPPHRDPVTGMRHYRLNIILKRSQAGGDFVCVDPLFETRRIKLFRPDVSTHSVTRVQGGSRYVLSLGWVLGGRRRLLRILGGLLALLAGTAAYTHLRSPESAASEESYPVWIALLKGYEGEVRYVGSDEAHAYFRIGRVFWSYYKLRSCAVQVPELLPVRAGSSYVVRLHVNPDNMINAGSACLPAGGYPVGPLDRYSN
jgi:hypothetical protein